MSNYLKIIIISLLLCLSLNSWAQQNDSIPPTRLDSIQVYYYHLQHLDSSLVREHRWLDTSYQAIQRYDPLLRQDRFFQTTGNIGLAHQSISFSPNTTTGFDAGIHSFDEYKIGDEDIRYYASMLPFTQLRYSTGSKKEQLFSVTHSHNIKRQVVIAAHFNIINAFGRRSFRQKSDDINTYFTASYTTRNQRYAAFAHYYYNRLKCMENGGILVDSLYEQFREGRNITQFAYGLTNALNTYKENAWFLKQVLNLDFRKKDSVSGEMKGVSLGHFTLSTSYKNPKYIYTDEGNSADYYPFFFGTNDSSTITDSIYYKRIENQLTWTNNHLTKNNQPPVFRFFASARHAYIEIHEEPNNTYISQLTPSAGFNLNLFQRLLLSASAEYVLGDVNGGDMKGQAGLSLILSEEKKPSVLNLEASFTKTELPWIAKHTYTSYYRWDNSFGKQQTISAALSFLYPRLKTSVQWVNMKDFLYWDQTGRPNQYSSGTINVFSLFVKKEFVFGKFAIDNKAILQYSTNENIIHLPLFTATQSYFFTFQMFKKALGVQTGIDLWYNTPYYADSWNPSTRQFTLQYDKKTGNYIYIDVFVNLKIKRAFLFLKLDHANAGLMGYNYYSTPHYPFADRAFKFGVSWLFHD